MLNVLSGFAVVVVIIALGYAVGRRGLLGPNAVYPLNMFVFYLATPALLVNFLRDADLAAVFGENLAVVVASTLLAGVVGFLGYRFIARRPVSDSLVTMLACSYCNGSNLGIPVATHVLDDPTASLPVIIFQVGMYGPLAVLLLDVSARRSGTHGGGLLPLVRELVLGIVRNPLILAAATGVTLSLVRADTGWVLPVLLAEPISLLAAATVPAALVAFGLSMSEVTVLDRESSPRRSVWFASLIKTVVHPLIAYTLARLVFDATGPALLASVVVAALPTAQNVFTYSQRFGANTVLARDSAVVSTMLSIPSIAVITVLLGSG
jgi:malonate transporter